MGPRKGGGRSGFVKSARSARPEDDVEAEQAGPVPAAAPAASPEKPAAAFLKDPPPGAADSGSSDEDEGQAPGGETRGKMVQRHKKVRAAATSRQSSRPGYHRMSASLS